MDIDLVLIDGNAIGHACHRATKLTYAGMQTQAIYGFVRTLADVRAKYPKASILVLWDGTAKHRFAMLPTYKSDRERRRQESTDEADSYREYQRQKPFIMKAVELMGIPQVRNPDLEADDLAGMIVASNSTAQVKRKILLVTGDGDWLQLISEDVQWYDPRNGGKLVTHETFYETTGFSTPREFLHGKALQGDDSDSIPNVAGIGDKGAVCLIARYRTVDELVRLCKDEGHVPDTPRHWKKFKRLAEDLDEQRRFYLNLRLMNLIDPERPDVGPTAPTKGRFDAEKLQTLFGRLGFLSILSDFNNFTTPFNPN